MTITPDDERAVTARRCVNCTSENIYPRDEGAIFEDYCGNCGTYTPAQAWSAGLLDTEPVLVFWPRSITVTALMMLLSMAFVVLFYKELKLASFDDALAKALGLRPGVLHYALMVLVSLVAVGAFDAVGSILVVAFFIIPPAAAYLLTDRLSLMLVISAIIGSLGAFFGYDLARGRFLGFVEMDSVLALINRVFGLQLLEQWDSSISASMVLMIFVFFVLAWVFSPKYGLISVAARRANQRRIFDDQVVLGHIYNHQYDEAEILELQADELHEHFVWSQAKMGRVLGRLRAAHLVEVANNIVRLTQRGEESVQHFRQHNLSEHMV